MLSKMRVRNFLRALIYAVLTVVVTVVAVVVVSDFIEPRFLASFSGSALFSPSDCNKVVGARALFWSLLAIEMIVLVVVPMMQPTEAELKDLYAVRPDTSTQGDDPWRPRASVVGVMAVILLCYAGSYGLAYDDKRACVIKSQAQDLVDYWSLFVVYLARGILVFAGCSLYLKWKYEQLSDGQ